MRRFGNRQSIVFEWNSQQVHSRIITGSLNTSVSIMSKVSSLLLVCLYFVSRAWGHATWSYNEAQGDGPSNWYKYDPKCLGRHQSPVDIVNAHLDRTLAPLLLEGYEVPLKEVTLVNNGHSARVETRDANATFSGGCLDSKYKFDHFHFHWGSDNSRGAEHLIDGKANAMEGHSVHVNVKYGTLEEAKKHPDGIAVLAVFYHVIYHQVPELKSLITAVQRAGCADIGDKVKVEKGLTMKFLLPGDLSFYCYRNGSLTTPSCDEAVTWTILRNPVYIGQSQINAFRNLKLPDWSPIVNNFRPVQPINDRTIYYRHW